MADDAFAFSSLRQSARRCWRKRAAAAGGRDDGRRDAFRLARMPLADDDFALADDDAEAGTT